MTKNRIFSVYDSARKHICQIVVEVASGRETEGEESGTIRGGFAAKRLGCEAYQAWTPYSQ